MLQSYSWMGILLTAGLHESRENELTFSQISLSSVEFKVDVSVAERETSFPEHGPSVDSEFNQSSNKSHIAYGIVV